ncbi:MAG TPA: hypothetical protein VNH11_24850 [Pirellulales bacterium]|nr:hypothetical protein [Pirellulales bacterium]
MIEEENELAVRVRDTDIVSAGKPELVVVPHKIRKLHLDAFSKAYPARMHASVWQIQPGQPCGYISPRLVRDVQHVGRRRFACLIVQEVRYPRYLCSNFVSS